ncbi:MAG: hypothetical protein II336_17965 [Loktanella sp.]|nr:hypothetical protein [Loktanella sp.]
MLADDAKKALVRVAAGESDTIEGWLAYGSALNEGRSLYPDKEGDRAFGEWVDVSQLATHADGKLITRDDRAAAMWAAANPDQFAEAREAGNARTVRGIHAKWQEIDDQRKREEAAKLAEQARAKAEAAAQEEYENRKRSEEARGDEERQEYARKADDAENERVQYENETRAWQETAEAPERPKLDQKKAHVANNSGNNEWYTPAPFVEAARAVMGGFDLDPASSEIANRTVQADRIFTQDDDGLKQDWPIGRVWMNPPYAQPLMGQFADKFAAEIRKGSEGVVLVNNATETAWFQTIAAECSAICFPKTRIRFLDPDGNPGAPLQGQAIIYCGPDVDAFKEAFGAFGLVVSHG